MPEYILYDLDGRKHTYLHLVDVRTALDTGLYFAEKPEVKKRKTSAPSKPEKKPSSFPSKIETKKTPAEKLRDDVHTKTDVEKMAETIKEKKP